ncbi:glycoside hydrolase family 38 C-terminal domain-containing protein [Clostridium oceanicum]|uniref:Mannosylglycerate hydrolase n=1 Tax=Clostridium oceanicum TaxID=1543 RepID=A0ABN1JQH7_9CLOT
MKTIHFIPHTHWDREWYRSSDAFKIRLTYTFDMLLHILDENEDYKYFVFDGQTAVLEEYLEIRPEMKEKINNYVKNKRIFIGPWYTQPDLYLVNGESILRNLLIGSNIAENMGHSMEIGWIPDAFGQIQTIPQIFKEIGMKGCFVWRGFDYRRTKDSVFLWEAPNGDKLLTVHFPLGYGHYRYLPEDKEKAYEDIKKVVSDTEERFKDDQILFMGGSDHARPQEEITEIIEGVKGRLKKEGYDIKISNPEIYVDEVSKSIKENKREIEITKGEARSADLGRIHAGISSTRMDIKNPMKRYEKLIQSIVEPMSVINSSLGGNYHQSLSNYFWKILFKNQFHDSIYSSSPESVNQSVYNRLLSLRHGLNEMIWLNFRFLRDKIDFSLLKENEEPIILFNTLPYKRKDLVFLNLYVKCSDFVIKDLNNNEIPYVKLNNLDKINNEIEYYNGLLNLNDKAKAEEKGELKQVQIKLDSDIVPSMGYKAIKICYREKTNVCIKSDLMCDEINKTFENKYLAVKINENGTLNITNKLNCVVYKDILWFEEKGDDGDEYNYSPPVKDKIINTKNSKPCIEIMENNKYEVKYRITHVISSPDRCINHNRSDNYVESSIITEVSLLKDDKKVRFKTKVVNNAKDHMIRAIFTDVEKSKTNLSEDHFGTIVRKNVIEKGKKLEDGATELVLPIYVMQRYVKLNETKNTFSVLSKEACEYEIYDDNKIALTLIRSVGRLGKEDLKIRPGRASGYHLKTPSSQVLKEVTSEYSIYIDEGIKEVSQISKEASMFCVDVQSRHIKDFTRDKNENMKEQFSLFDVDDRLGIMAFKKSEKGSSYVLRLLNQSDKNIDDATLNLNSLIKEVCLSNVKEEEISKINIKDNKITIPNINKQSFVTLILKSRS